MRIQRGVKAGSAIGLTLSRSWPMRERVLFTDGLLGRASCLAVREREKGKDGKGEKGENGKIRERKGPLLLSRTVI